MFAIARLGVLLGLVSLGSCSRYLNTSRIEANIQDDIERQGRRLSLQAVICPNRVVKQAEAYFRCVGELPDGGQFTINVTQQDDQGTVSWDVPSSKVLINLASLEEKIQKDIKAAVGKGFAIDCGHTYRVNQRGDAFECDIVGAGAIASGRVESVLVKVNGDSNLEWQEIVISNAPTPAAAASSSSTTSSSTTSSTPSKPSTAASSSPATTANTKPSEDTATTASEAPNSTAAATTDVDEDDDGDRQ